MTATAARGGVTERDWGGARAGARSRSEIGGGVEGGGGGGGPGWAHPGPGTAVGQNRAPWTMDAYVSVLRIHQIFYHTYQH
jgi:hypothetical protein